MTRVALPPENSTVTNAWISAYEAISAAEDLYTVYTEKEGYTRDCLGGFYLKV